MKEFNSQICTSREQSERLLALGLKKETADMVLVPSSRHDGSDVIRVRKSYLMEEDAIPAWSLHRLWELANIKYIIIDSEDEIAVLYDEVIMKIEQFIKDGYFNKEYLEEKK
jgi:hypothetical protein